MTCSSSSLSSKLQWYYDNLLVQGEKECFLLFEYYYYCKTYIWEREISLESQTLRRVDTLLHIKHKGPEKMMDYTEKKNFLHSVAPIRISSLCVCVCYSSQDNRMKEKYPTGIIKNFIFILNLGSQLSSLKK